VSIDQEGGSYQGLDATNGFDTLPAVTDICMAMSGEAIAEFARTEVGEPLAQVGVNMNFAPVIDVALNAQSDIIVRNGRACSDDPARVAAFGRQVSDGLTRAGVIPVGKHFPGHGDVAGDTHSAAVFSRKTVARLEAEDLVPFKAFVDARGPAIMVSHIVVTAVDDTAPASLSQPVVTGILRELYGFEGVVITDDLTMKAVTEYTRGQTAAAARQAILAGVDLLIIGHSDANDVVSEVCRGLNTDNGEALRSRIIDANGAILDLKQRFGIRTPQS
jgi:beta-N-acetylhexosaminidase